MTKVTKEFFFKAKFGFKKKILDASEIGFSGRK